MKNQPGRILVVDDYELNRDMLVKWIERKGHHAVAADGAETALAQLESESFDLVLLDIMMPGVDGFEVLRRIRARKSLMELPIIMVTAKDQPEDIVRALELGANDYITKPLEFSVVLARVQTQLTLKNLADQRQQFLQIASHDLKNPLTAILAASHTIPLIAPVGKPVTPELVDLLGRIERRGKEMKKIIEDFLDFHALEDGRLQTEFQPVNLNALLAETVDALREYAESKKIILRLEAEPPYPVIRADPTRLIQVVQNLLGNAIKFSPPGRNVRAHLRPTDAEALIEICDEGPGLTDEDLNKLFIKYARLSNKPTAGEKSSGLGLSICRHLVELHGGRIGARRNDGPGATFWFTLPL